MQASRGPEAQFELTLRGEGAQVTWALGGERTVIGTDPACEVVLEEAASVMRRHAVIRLDEARPTLTDLETPAGTEVNGRRIASASLEHLDVIGIGPHALTFCNRGRSVAVESLPEPFGTSLFLVEEDFVYEGIVPLDPEEDRPSLDAVLAKVVEHVAHLGSLQEILNAALSVLFEVVPADRGFILIHDPHRDSLLPMAARSRSAHAAERLACSMTLFHRVRDDRRAVLLQDALVHPDFADVPSVKTHRLRSVLCVPLFRGETFLGVLQLDTSGRRRLDRVHSDLAVCLSHVLSLAIDNQRLQERLRQEGEVRARLSSLVGRRLMDAMLHGQLTLNGEAQVMPLAILFADIRGYSSLARRMRPADLFDLLNRLFEELSDGIFEFEGIVAQFVGDEIKALFGGPWGRCGGDEAAVQALRAALRLREALAGWPCEEDGQPIQMGFGLGFGSLALGPVGGAKRADFSFHGASANEASRLCRHAGAMEILVSESAMEAIRRRLSAEVSRDGLVAADSFRLRAVSPVDARNVGRVAAWQVLPAEDLR